MPVPVATQLPSTSALPAGNLSSVAALAATCVTALPGEAAARAAALNLQHNLAKIQAEAMPEHYEAELEINDFPQNARWKVTHKETLIRSDFRMDGSCYYYKGSILSSRQDSWSRRMQTLPVH